MTLKTDPGKALFVHILNERIILEGWKIRTLLNFEPNKEFTEGTIPAVITLTDGGDKGENEESFIFFRKKPLPPDHPHYNPNNPDDLYVQEKVRWDIYNDEKMTIHIWAHNNEIRDHIVHMVKELVKQAKMNYYKFCTRYNKNTEICNTTNQPCDSPQKSTFDSVENRCPYPEITDHEDPHYRNPGNIFEKTGIRTETLQYKGKSSSDQLGILPPICHTVLTFEYTRDEILVMETVPCTGFNVDIHEK